MPGIEIHPSIANIVLEDVLAASLRANRLDPKLLYVTPRQAALWREVSLKHSPIHTNPEFSRIYRDAYDRIVERVRGQKVHLVGLGPGTGRKEAELAARLRSHGCEVEFTAIDASRDLVEESAKRVVTTGAGDGRHLVCDLAELDFIKDWLDAKDRESPRLFTFFGLVPNLEPQFVTQLFSKLLRSDDALLVSVHLAPVDEGLDLEAAMKRVLPQYDNPETLAWLRTTMDYWKLGDFMEEPKIVAGERKDLPCIGGIAPWKSHEAYLKFAPDAGEFADVSFSLFFSLRYTPALFEELLRQAGVRGERLAMTTCREEAIWEIRRADGVG